MKVSDYIADLLTKHGIDTCFTVTGGGAMHLNDSFGNHKQIKCIYNHHEQACAMAAEGYTRITNKPAIVCVTSGPATTNTLTGVLGAWLDSIPMIIISGQMQTNTIIQSTPLPLRQFGFQEFNIVDSVKCMTKYAATVTDAKYIPYHLEKALHICQESRKGPVWLDIPLDIQSAKLDFKKTTQYNFGFGEIETHSSKNINSAFIKDIYKKVNKAKRPVILAGYGVRMSDAYSELLKAVNALKIPVVTEWNSNDLISNDHDYFAGRPGTIGDRGGNFVLQNADLVLAIGCQFSIRQISYAWQNFAKNAYIIAVDTEKYEMLKPSLRINLPVQIDIKMFLHTLTTSKNKSIHNKSTDWYKWCKNINKKYPVAQEKHFKSKAPISVYAFMKTLSDVLTSKDTVVLANGAACVAGLQTINIKPNQRVFTNAGASSMGYALPAAIGAAVATNNKENIICIEGDGSIQMNLQELQTVIHNNLNIKIFWINNDGYHSIKQTQLSMFNAKEKGFYGADKNSGISFPSAEKIAKAYGLKFFKIANITDLSKLNSVINFTGPVICEVVTDPNEKFEPKLQSKLLPDGSFFTPSLEDMYPFLSEEEMKKNQFKPS